MTKHKMSVRKAKNQIRLGISPAGSESSLHAQWVAKDPSILHADSADYVDAQVDQSLLLTDSSPQCQYSHIAAQIKGKDINCNMELNNDIVTCILEGTLICWFRHISYQYNLVPRKIKITHIYFESLPNADICF